MLLTSGIKPFIPEDVTDLNYNWTSIKAYNQKRSKKIRHESIWFADFEADPSDKHIPYCCNWSNLEGSMKKSSFSLNCGEELLKDLPDKSMVYFHNMSYDLNFLAKYGIKA